MSLMTKLIETKKGLLFEGKHVVAMVAPSPAAAGHIWIVPKAETAVFGNAPDFVVAEMFVIANRISMALFEAMHSEGTNLIIQNGTGAGQVLPHLILHIVPRVENDNLPLLWQPKQLDEEAMSTVELKLKAECKNVGVFDKEKPKPIEQPKAEEIKPDAENYQLKHIRRIP
jgi:histidine triad (HIT) family protein